MLCYMFVMCSGTKVLSVQTGTKLASYNPGVPGL